MNWADNLNIANKLFNRMILIFSFVSVLISCFSCSLIKAAAGADFDTAAYQKAREARITEIKMRETSGLLKRAAKAKLFEDAEIVVKIGSNLLNKIAGRFVGVEGWLDEDNSFITDSIFIELKNGYGIASLKLRAKNHNYGIDVMLIMDCLAVLKYKENELYLGIEPFNISPVVETGFLLSGLRETIRNLLLLNLGELGNKFKGIKIPLNIDNSFLVKGSEHIISGKVNAAIALPDIAVALNLKLSEVIFLEEGVVVTFDIAEGKANKR